MFTLYIRGWEENNKLHVNIETFITVFVYRVSLSSKIKLKLFLHLNKPEEPLLVINISDLYFETIEILPDCTSFCNGPVILYDKNVISGLCSVARCIVRHSDKAVIRDLLGFREACLIACAESSVWTKFCEIDFPNTIKSLLGVAVTTGTFIVPEAFVRFEKHLSEPVRMHNVYKVARQKLNNKTIESCTPINQLGVDHTFGEGPFVTLSDIILYACMKIAQEILSSNLLRYKLPLIYRWLHNVEECGFPVCDTEVQLKIDANVVVIADIACKSLYKGDRTNEVLRKHTKQYKIDDALGIVEEIDYKNVNSYLPYGHEVEFDWEKIPLEANPNGGALPEKRADRKCKQLENLTRAVLKLAGQNKYKIVDFCSGSGHLGILLAYLLPHCTIILVENKEKSLERARERINNLGITNIIVVQSNLDYFVGSFDVGVSLHACGVASDLVIEKCITNRAHFVSCPCCYGSIKVCHQLSYPRSEKYINMFKNRESSYFNLAHAADQTHDLNNEKTGQGYTCMDIIDNDRALHAQERGYEVFLGKLQPPTCTNKNNLLVGIFRDM